MAVIGLGGRAILGDAGVKLGGKTGNLIAPFLAQRLGGGPGSAGGDIFFAAITAVAFTTILAVVSGVVLAASGAAAHDVYGSVMRRGEATEQEEIRAGRFAVSVIGVVGVIIALLAGKTFNVQILTGLAFAVAASANFPALLLSLTWRRLTTTGAVIGILTGLISSIVLIILSPQVWSGPDSAAPFPLGNPGDRHRPAGLHRLHRRLAAFGRDEVAEASFDEVRVRCTTGIGSEAAEPRSTPRLAKSASG